MTDIRNGTHTERDTYGVGHTGLDRLGGTR